MRKNLSENKGALSTRQRLKRRQIYDRDIQLKEIDFYGINKPDVKGIVCINSSCKFRRRKI